MKKIVILAITLGITLNVSADNNWLRKKTLNKETFQNKSKLKNNIKIYSTETKVPTFTKNSRWEVFNNSWDEQFAEESIYINNKISAIYRYNYSRTDTLGRTMFYYNSDHLPSMQIYEYYIPGTGFIPQNRVVTTYFNSNSKNI